MAQAIVATGRMARAMGVEVRHLSEHELRGEQHRRAGQEADDGVAGDAPGEGVDRAARRPRRRRPRPARATRARGRCGREGRGAGGRARGGSTTGGRAPGCSTGCRGGRRSRASSGTRPARRRRSRSGRAGARTTRRGSPRTPRPAGSPAGAAGGSGARRRERGPGWRTECGHPLGGRAGLRRLRQGFAGRPRAGHDRAEYQRRGPGGRSPSRSSSRLWYALPCSWRLPSPRTRTRPPPEARPERPPPRPRRHARAAVPRQGRDHPPPDDRRRRRRALRAHRPAGHREERAHPHVRRAHAGAATSSTCSRASPSRTRSSGRSTSPPSARASTGATPRGCCPRRRSSSSTRSSSRTAPSSTRCSRSSTSASSRAAARSCKCPLLSVFGASNEVPGDETLTAIFDRFLLRVRSDNLDAYHFNELLQRGIQHEIRQMTRRVAAPRRRRARARRAAARPSARG